MDDEYSGMVASVYGKPPARMCNPLLAAALCLSCKLRLAETGAWTLYDPGMSSWLEGVIK